MEYRVYVVHPVNGPELVGWCYEECELALFVEELEDKGHVVEVAVI